MEETENKTKISREIAEQDFNNWCEELEIDYDTNEMNADEKKDFEVLKDRIVKAIMTGRCVIDGDVMHYTLSKKNESGIAGMVLDINPPTSKTFIGCDGFKDTQRIHKMCSCMSAITGKDIGFFSKLWGKDFSFMTTIVTLFLSI